MLALLTICLNFLVPTNATSLPADVACTTVPALRIAHPGNMTYHSATVQVVLVAPHRHHVETMWYAWNGTNVTYDGPVDVLFDEGQNTLRAWANDSKGRVATAAVSFTIDTGAPSVRITSPANGTCTSTVQRVEIDATGRRGVERTWYAWNGTNVTYDGPVDFLFDEGQNTLRAWAIDSKGRVATAGVSFVVDSIGPSVRIKSPANATCTSAVQRVEIAATSVAGIDRIGYAWNGTNVTYCGPVDVGVTEGPNTVRAWANDTAGRVATAELVFTIKTPPPVVRVTSLSNVTYPSAIQRLEIAATSVIGLDIVWYNWNETNVTYGGPVDVRFAEGPNTVRAWASDRAGRVATAAVSFTIDVAGPGLDHVQRLEFLQDCHDLVLASLELFCYRVRAHGPVQQLPHLVFLFGYNAHQRDALERGGRYLQLREKLGHATVSQHHLDIGNE